MLRKFGLCVTTSALAIGVALSAQAAPSIYNAAGLYSQAFVAGTYEIIVSGAQGGGDTAVPAPRCWDSSSLPIRAPLPWWWAARGRTAAVFMAAAAAAAASCS